MVDAVAPVTTVPRQSNLRMSKTLTIAPRFNGPPGSGNGGYVCGLMAARIDGASEAVLRAPPPLGVALTLAATADGVALRHGETLVGEARPAQLDIVPPPAPSLAQARAAAHLYVGLDHHRFPSCFVCGCLRPAHDGLEIFPGPVEGRAMVACTWTPAGDLADAQGRVAPEFIHAERPRVGEELIVAAWHLASDGRKHRSATALYNAEGAVIARSEALWIEPKS
jgi:hypothetical protein